MNERAREELKNKNVLIVTDGDECHERTWIA